MDRRADERTGGQIDGLLDEQSKGQMNERTGRDRRTNRRINDGDKQTGGQADRMTVGRRQAEIYS